MSIKLLCVSNLLCKQQCTLLRFLRLGGLLPNTFKLKRVNDFNKYSSQNAYILKITDTITYSARCELEKNFQHFKR